MALKDTHCVVTIPDLPDINYSDDGHMGRYRCKDKRSCVHITSTIVLFMEQKMFYTHGIKLGNTHFFRFVFHLDSNNRKAIDKTRKIISPL